MYTLGHSNGKDHIAFKINHFSMLHDDPMLSGSPHSHNNTLQCWQYSGTKD